MAYTPPFGALVDLALDWSYAPQPGGAVPLAFGVEPPPPIRSGLSVLVGGGWADTTRALRAEPAPSWLDVPRRTREPAAGWSAGQPLRAAPASPWADAPRRRTETGPAWTDAPEHPRRELASRWTDVPRRRAARALEWQAGTPRAVAYTLLYHDAARRRLSRGLPWGEYRHVPVSKNLAYRNPPRKATGWTLPWDQNYRIRWSEPWGKLGYQPLGWALAGAPVPVWAPPLGSAVPLPLQCRLLDWPGYAVWLIFRSAPCPSITHQRVWFVSNSISVVRLPDRTPVPVLALGLATDYDSWAWEVRATLPDRAALDLVAPTGSGPVAIEATVNGYVWKALVESYTDSRQFGRPGYTITGRSHSAALAAPYAPPASHEEATDKTAQQLAAAELTPAGWALTWDPPDWLVPAGAWAYHERTPIEAVGLLAGAVGGRVQTDRSADTLRVLSRYPVSPWGWATAAVDASVTDNLIRSLSLAWQPRQAVNGVYVSGEAQGVLCNVRRTATAGTPYAPMVVDPLITHQDAGRERGRVILAGCGDQAVVTIELPLFPSPQPPGLLEPGQLVEVADGVETWRGLVVGLQVEAGRPSVVQRVEIERHY